MSYSLDGTSCDCYEGTACLINKYNIKDEQKLSLLEAGITFAKTAELLSNNLRKILTLNITSLFIMSCLMICMIGQENSAQ